MKVIHLENRDSGQTKMSAGRLTWQRPSWELLWTKAGHHHLTLLQTVHVFLNLLIPAPLRRLGAGGEATCPRPAQGDPYGGLCSQPECGSCLHPFIQATSPCFPGWLSSALGPGLVLLGACVCAHVRAHMCVIELRSRCSYERCIFCSTRNILTFVYPPHTC